MTETEFVPYFSLCRTPGGQGWQAIIWYDRRGSFPATPCMTRWGARRVGRRELARVVREDLARRPQREALDRYVAAIVDGDWADLPDLRRVLDGADVKTMPVATDLPTFSEAFFSQLRAFGVPLTEDDLRFLATKARKAAK